MDVIETLRFEKDAINFTVKVVCFNEYSGFGDEWQMTDDHQGGVTVKNPDHHRGGYKYAIPLQYTLAERINQLTEAGDENPCATAYQQAQDSLRRDLDASDYGFLVSAEINGIMLLNDESSLGYSFDYSYLDKNTLEFVASECFTEDGIMEEALEAAKAAAGAIVEQMEALKKIS